MEAIKENLKKSKKIKNGFAMGSGVVFLLSLSVILINQNGMGLDCVCWMLSLGWCCLGRG